MTNYAGLSPRDALAAWYAQRNPADPNTLDMTDLARQNPAAWQLYKTGQDKPGDSHTREIFNNQTGTWDDQQKHGWFSHPESWLQLGLGGAMGGAGAAGLFGGAASGAGGAGGATSAALGTGASAAIPTTAGIASATSLGLPVTAGLGSAGAAGAAGAGAAAGAAGWGSELGIPTTAGITDATGIGTTAALPSMADISGLVAGGGLSGAGGLSSLLTDPKWSPLIKALAGVGGLLGGKALANNAQQNAVPPQLSQLLDLAMQRANAQTPLFNAANQGAYAMLPDFAKKGGG